MPRRFGGLAEFERFLANLPGPVHEALQEGLKHAALMLEQAVKDEIDTLKLPVDGRGDEPGRDELRESINHALDGLEALVGSTLEKAANLELGSDRSPPRPFLEPALVKIGEELAEGIGKALLAALEGESSASG